MHYIYKSCITLQYYGEFHRHSLSIFEKELFVWLLKNSQWLICDLLSFIEYLGTKTIIVASRQFHFLKCYIYQTLIIYSLVQNSLHKIYKKISIRKYLLDICWIIPGYATHLAGWISNKLNKSAKRTTKFCFIDLR